MALNSNQNHRPHLTQQAHDLIRAHFEDHQMSPSIAIDATCGNGNDTLFLAELCNQVYAFDIQEIALEKTRERLNEGNLIAKVKLIHSGHENLHSYDIGAVDCIMFNLGYLPKTDKSITTLSRTSLTALNSSLEMLIKPHGLLSILCYPGHLEGKHETRAIKQWLKLLPIKWDVKEYLANVPNEKSPILFLITHKKRA